jgi:pyruvate formate lyase activating enzyme
MPTEYSSSVEECTAEAVITDAKNAGCNSIAYTYVEPAIFYEYVDDVARLAHAAGLLNIFKTNGFMSPEVIESSSSYIDAANVDLKTFSDATYKHFGGRLDPILDNLKLMKAMGIWLEVTTVIIPGMNDTIEELEAIARFIARELGVDAPWHISRFFPAYKLAHVLPTPIETLERARQIGFAQGLRYVYLSNVPLSGYQDTLCPKCAQTLIRRHGFAVLDNFIEDECCSYCGVGITGVRLTPQ